MKKRRKMILILLFITGLFELVSAPAEWLWPRVWGGHTFWRGSTGHPEIALTFDDGPSRYTAQILDMLRKRQVPATFFVMGRQAERYPEMIQRMAAEGHEIGNHTYSFAARRFLFYANLPEWQIARTQQVVADLTGIRPKYFRSPGGQMGRNLWNYVRRHHLQVVNGALPLPHPSKSAEEQLEIILQTLQPGAILILHDGDDHEPDSQRPQSTVVLLPKLFAELDARGYRVVPLRQLLEGSPESAP